MYFIAALFGSLFSIKPDLASAIWPAAGIAVGLCILWGRTILPAIALASLSYYLFGLQAYQPLNWILGVALALSCTLQAYVGYRLVSPILNKRFSLLTPTDILKFFIRLAPISCLISASINIPILIWANILPANNWFFNWVTWWVGDLLGCLLISPAIILITYRSLLNLKQNIVYLLTPSLLIFCLVITAFQFSRVQQSEKQQEIVDKRIKEVEFLIKTRLELYQVYLHSLASFFNNSQQVTQAEFTNFSQQMLNNKIQTQAIEWIKVVENTQIPEFYRQLSSIHGREIKPLKFNPSQSKQIYPIVYAHPKAENSKIIGLDLSSEKLRFNALQKAIDSKEMSLSQPVDLFQGTVQKKGFLLFKAVFDSDKPTATAIGLVALVTNYYDLFNSITYPLLNQVHTDKYQLQVTHPNGTMLFDKNQLSANEHYLSQTSHFNFLDQPWQMKLSISQNSITAQKDWLSWSILAIGTLIAVSVQLFIIWLMSNRNLIARTVKRKTKELNKEKEKAEQATLQKTYFLANMSHELRTPLNAIMGLSDMLKTTELDHTQQDYVRKIRVASKTLLTLISDVLDLSKVETGKIELETERFSLNRLVNRITELFSAQIKQKGLSFQVKYTPLVQDKLLGDEHRLQQVIMNLCSNAIKFTEYGGIQLAITYKTDVNHNDQFWLHIEVTDTGTGIPQDRITSIFDSFTQADPSITRKFGGTGLGLSISQTLIKLMGGTLQCESQLGVGSRFYFDLLLAKSESQNKHLTTTQPLSLQQQAEQQLNGMPVLVAEDNEINQQIIIFQLEQLGANVTLAENGQQAIDKVASNHFPLILMDIQMPVLDGIAATTEILKMENGRNSKIVAMTANVSIQDKKNCFNAGMIEHIPKPFDVDKLHQTIIDVLTK
ncbi:CHASE domain-containing protein [Catenovulum adriaticum]|uniref:histidine kinase n=1 Tax=Catenovulum adriaticum TaxID=2984846 RepID=A0ABY7AL06_9ALTE|nr:CHASE domain-containing protein [Catenovulum sp. TS8]WAJ70250.1 CHASE domain-containing protein [Catenovulum sp. TS8]